MRNKVTIVRNKVKYRVKITRNKFIIVKTTTNLRYQNTVVRLKIAVIYCACLYFVF